MPKMKVSPDGAAKVLLELLAKPVPAKVDINLKKAVGNDKSSDKKSANKKEEGSRGQTEVAAQKTTALPAENGETENQSPASGGEANSH